MADACNSKTNSTYQLEHRTNTILKLITNKNKTQQTNKYFEQILLNTLNLQEFFINKSSPVDFFKMLFTITAFKYPHENVQTSHCCPDKI